MTALPELFTEPVELRLDRLRAEVTTRRAACTGHRYPLAGNDLHLLLTAACTALARAEKAAA